MWPTRIVDTACFATQAAENIRFRQIYWSSRNYTYREFAGTNAGQILNAVTARGLVMESMLLVRSTVMCVRYNVIKCS